MQGAVGKYRYVRSRILRLLAYRDRDSHIRWLSKTIEFAGDERCLPIF